jgi:NitT/TauT family transport system substrate-binding protein
MTSEVGLDPQRDIRWVTDPQGPKVKPIDRFIEGKIDAFLGFAPEPQELRARHIGHVLVNTAVDHPWSQYLCCRSPVCWVPTKSHTMSGATL